MSRHFASSDRVELARMRGDTVWHRKARYAGGGIRGLVSEAEARDLDEQNNTLVDVLAKKINAGRGLRDAAFVSAHESLALSEWLARASLALTNFYASRESSYPVTNGRVDLPEVQLAFPVLAQQILSDWTSSGFDEIQRRATIRTAATGFVMVTLVGAGLWYVKKHRKR